MKIFARPKASTAERNSKMGFSQRMSPRYAYEIERVFEDKDGVKRVALSGYSKAHTMNYTAEDYTFEDAIKRPVVV